MARIYTDPDKRPRSPLADTRTVDDRRIGAALRTIRRRRALRQSDVAERARVSRQLLSSIERGDLDHVSLLKLRALAQVLGARVDLLLRWRGADLDRLVSGRHAAMQEAAARQFASLAGWDFAQEVSHSIYGERGIIDLLAWHAERRAILVVELKTVLVDINDLVGQMDRRRRLARSIARERGWDPATTSAWVVIEDSRANRRRLAAHSAMLRHAFPTDGRALRPWLRAPVEPIAALSFLSIVGTDGIKQAFKGVSRVRTGSAVDSTLEAPRVGVPFHG
jgi:transcriptional regulator with XRE-family HTH domain